MVSVLICVEFSSKNVVLKFSRFYGGIGFSILAGEVFVGSGSLAISVLCGICSMTG